MAAALFAFVLLLRSASGYIVPGIYPQDFKEGEPLQGTTSSHCLYKRPSLSCSASQFLDVL